jgi:hypothetical protein
MNIKAWLTTQIIEAYNTEPFTSSDKDIIELASVISENYQACEDKDAAFPELSILLDIPRFKRFVLKRINTNLDINIEPFFDEDIDITESASTLIGREYYIFKQHLRSLILNNIDLQNYCAVEALDIDLVTNTLTYFFNINDM